MHVSNHLRDWKARRAGGRITVTGIGSDGQPAKIVGVDYIVPAERGAAYVVAVDKHGTHHNLEMAS